MASGGLLHDFRRLTSTAVIYGIGVVLLRGISYLLLPLFTRYLSTDEYGLVAVSTSMTSLLLAILPLGCDAALAKFYFSAQSDEEKADAVRTCWLTASLLSLIGAVVFELSGPLLCEVLVPGVSWHPFLRAALWCAVFQTQIQFLGNLLKNRVQPKAYVAVSAVTSLLNVGATLLLVIAFQQGAAGYVVGAMLAAAFAAILSTTLLWRTSGGRYRRALAWQMLGFGLPLVPHIISGWLLELSDRALMRRYLTLEDVGIYSVGYQVGSLVAIVASCLNNACSPYLFRQANDSSEAGLQRLGRLTTYYVVGMCGFTLTVILFAEPLVALLAAPKYAAAARIVPWIAASHLLVSFYYIPTNMLTTRGATGFISLATIASALLNLGLNVLLLPTYGRLAAAWATLASYGLMFALVWIASRRRAPLPYEGSRLLKIATAFAAVILLEPFLPSSSLATSLLVRTGLLLSFPGLMLILGFLHDSEWAVLGRGLQRIGLRSRSFPVPKGQT